MSSEYKAARHRSPAHPALTLRVAIEKAQALWNQDGLVWVPAQVAVEHMGYAHTNGNGGRALAALSYFGLVERDGKSDDRRVRLTPLGQAIVMDDRPDSPEREQAIRRAALSPKLYAAIWENLGEGSQLPSDANLEFALKSTYRVNKDTVGKFVRDFRATLEFAGLIGDAATATPDDMANDPDDGPAAVTVERETASPAGPRAGRNDVATDVGAAPGTVELTIPLIGGGVALLRTPAPLSHANFSFLQQFIAMCEPSLVEGTSDDHSRARDSDSAETGTADPDRV
ncbi:hypothetical protein HN371_16480 [Candidatus Poribacteria bacterium]|jgi:hypothetical protein|nr:hypothetical protein [Candidatus Poribacteria bacterium]MBT5535694.1 hypothetical protein [Candidatus Poribacteria bacterium]MBT5712288.1 hypothetical protein [Candidatus Poribacteria bacterium]MBT7099011.1 hypothetical protein [Candidatus Poribacteria bacterium]MBT7809257.1 hypothetical protein [Candidatus Poribacteria bacterium]